MSALDILTNRTKLIKLTQLKSEILTVLEGIGINKNELIDFMLSDNFSLNYKSGYYEIEYDNIRLRRINSLDDSTTCLIACKTSNLELEVTICEYTEYQ
jgi:hypothetical protein